MSALTEPPLNLASRDSGRCMKNLGIHSWTSPNETFYLDLFGLSSNALFTKYRGIGTILNDD
jgi:hypothetical protein